jgi:ubiquitin C-terminal hydrolase
VDLSEFYNGVAPGAVHYRLRSMVCYYGQHYLAFAWAHDLAAWLMFDDANVSRVGAWADVRRKCEAGRIQPSVLFYEAAA